jgi:hypothetical protein
MTTPDLPPLIDAGSPEHMATLTEEQLRALAASRRPEHIVPGFSAALELARRGLEVPAQRPVAGWREDPDIPRFGADDHDGGA